MLSQLAFKNFKSWPEVRLPLAPITLLFGANSSGKSSILQFLLLLKQTKDATDRSLVFDFGNDRTPVNLGSYQDVVFRHKSGEVIEWELEWRPREEFVARAPAAEREFRTSSLRISSAVEFGKNQIKSKRIVYCLHGDTFSLIESEKGYELKSDAAGFSFRRIQGRPPALPGPMKSYAFPDLAKTNFQNADFLAELEAAYESQMDLMYHLGPLREFPKRQYGWAGTRPTDVGRRGEYVVEAILAARAAGDRINIKKGARLRPFEEVVAHWLKHLGLISSFRVEEIGAGSNLYRVWVKSDKAGAEVLITDVGFGVSQVMPAIVLLLYVPEGSTIILEQPEIHLHPRVQAALADVLVYACKHRNVQVLVESHSEHLLRRLQRRIAEAEIGPETARLYFCSLDGGRSAIEPLRLNELGHIENWPDHFFGDDFEEISAMQTASLERLTGQRAR